ncbi:putative methyltransferase [Medicago truncatula]|uniref:Caffeoyl-CoA O-methyltransferase n=1 Tax=Medicago truncatula TaxID=3880 RepID=I3SHI5_MEDTR|nr:probable caffeoyl-CoA O-methyltransferase At4g26220 [Medicago truncatula]AFK39727.1 unknown [Medicago truncatula]KEH18483.1 caffeoyl-CoA O-methyltransferase [Medicago truncatula]RHN39493.1 putative methyltransferase [Medicago truncatula]
MENLASKYDGILQSGNLTKYILETSVYPREPESLKELRNATASYPMHFMGTHPDAGKLMGILLKLLNAKKTIEIGVFTGYSLLLTALNIPDDGKIIALDPDRKAYEVGLPFIKKAGVEHKIDFTESPALPVLDKLLEDPSNDENFDFAFVDADKHNYWNYHERLIKLIKIGGLIIYDNTLWGGTVAWPEEALLDPRRKKVRQDAIAFNNAIASDTRIEICLASIGDGFTICRRAH